MSNPYGGDNNFGGQNNGGQPNMPGGQPGGQYGGSGWGDPNAGGGFGSQQGHSYGGQQGGQQGQPYGGQPYGAPQGASAYGAPGGQSPKKSSGSKMLVPAIIAAVVVLALIGGAAYWFMTAESRALKGAVKGIEETMNAAEKETSLVASNKFVCEQYRGDEAKLKEVDESLSDLTDGFDVEQMRKDLGIERPVVNEDTVAFTDDSRETATLTHNNQKLAFKKEDGKWLVCDKSMNMKEMENLNEMPGLGDTGLDSLPSFDDTMKDFDESMKELDKMLEDLNLDTPTPTF
ncbi:MULTISPECIES: hypothetical protein [unclassified Corynebacterium]|uniref:hypothetical protein n=1 Tax=unclassified Corynebacterium TaxID=2624378 RepID=UPI0030A759A9